MRYSRAAWAVLFLSVSPAWLSAQPAQHDRAFWLTIAQNPCEFDGAHIPFTISAGVVEWIPSEGATQFYKRADVQLYAAKHQGRNRVC